MLALRFCFLLLYKSFYFHRIAGLIEEDAVAGQPITVSVSGSGQIKDGRLNGYDLGAPFAVYCVPNEFVRVIYIRQSGANVLAFEAKFTEINKDAAAAKSTAK